MWLCYADVVTPEQKMKMKLRLYDRMAQLPDVVTANEFLESAGMSPILVNELDGSSEWDVTVGMRKQLLANLVNKLSDRDQESALLQWDKDFAELDNEKAEVEKTLDASDDQADRFKGVRLFASHLTNDKTIVSDVKLELKQRWGISMFVAHEDIKPNADWAQTIMHCLSNCDAGVAVITDAAAFRQSTWCDQEVGWMLGRFVDRVLPLRFFKDNKPQDPYGPLGTRQALTVKTGESATDIADGIAKWCSTRPGLNLRFLNSLASAYAKTRDFEMRNVV